MKKIWQIALLLCCALVTVSCGSDDEDEKIDEVWKSKNQTEFLKISADKEYTELKSQSNGGSIYYKVLKEGNGTERIYYNSKVRMYYTGSFVVDDEKVFETHEPPYQDPADFNVNNVVDGWTTALMNMKEGDRWEIWIPYQLGYGTGGSGADIPGYTTLRFELEVVKILEQ